MTSRIVVQLLQLQPRWEWPPPQDVIVHADEVFVLSVHLNEAGALEHSSKLTKPGPNI